MSPPLIIDIPGNRPPTGDQLSVSTEDDFTPGFGREDFPEAGRQAIADAGYDADYVIANDTEIDLETPLEEREAQAEQLLKGLTENERALFIDSARAMMPVFQEAPRRFQSSQTGTGEPASYLGAATKKSVETTADGIEAEQAQPVNDLEAAQYGLELITRFNFRDIDLVRLAHRMSDEDVTPKQKLAFHFLQQMYEKKDVTWDGLLRATGNLFTSPSTYVGLTSFGLGSAAAQAAKTAGMQGVKAYIKSQIPSSIALGVEGGAYASLDNAMKQSVENTAADANPEIAEGLGMESEFGLGENLAHTALGTALGGTVGMTAPALINKAIEGFEGMVQGAKDGVLGMGVGPVAKLKMAPEGSRGHKVPHNLLVEGTGAKAITPVTQSFNQNNKAANFAAIDQLKQNHIDALKSPENWLNMEAEAFGGDFLPVPPMQAINYANDPAMMAEKLKRLSPEMKAGVDEGFANVQAIRSLYDSGAADEEMTANLFVWGILSRGAGPVQQESAYIDIIADAAPLVKKVVDGTFGDAERKTWEAEMRKLLPTGSPGKQVTMNVNAAGKLLQVLSAVPEGQSETALRTIHNMIADPNVSAAQIRRSFMELTDKPGIDNKVVSFILLVAGRDDVLVMDRIQSRHLWDDGRFEGANIYDGFMKEGTTAAEGLQGIMRGPRGLFITEALEDGLRPNVAEAYRMVGREQDASLGRFHWETWVIDGEQVVDHSTLQAVAKGDVIGAGVTEGKPGTFSSGIRYMRGKEGAVVRYPLSDGSFVFLKPETQKQFEAFIRKPKSGIIPPGFKVGERKDIPWYERPEVNRDALDAAARQFADSDADGAIKASAAQP